MKKIFSILLIGMTLCTTFACSQKQNNNEDSNQQQQSETQQPTTPTAKQYKINYNLNGGINSNLNVEILNEGENLTLNTPEKYAYIFK